jgi:hypothetical protein
MIADIFYRDIGNNPNDVIPNPVVWDEESG